jgi:Histidine kinase-, DNA gyrase B-, and HSP90-like ATPase
MSVKQYSDVSTKPVKRFFVDMLTRDIGLEDAILDLLDNCVDGILRHPPKGLKTGSATPYAGFKAAITLSKKNFCIEDNCGGIPWSEHGRAFRMGSPAQNSASKNVALTVGAYGIGMKRAIFKMGRTATISTRTSDDQYEVVIPKGWMDAQDDWDLKVKESKTALASTGTKILIADLNEATAARFEAEAFFDDLLDKVETHYSIILAKGFEVSVNGRVAKPKRIAIKFSESSGNGDVVRPYIFRSTLEDGIDVFLTVGLREPIPDAETTLNEQEDPRLSTDYAGWTIICNDRVVLYCNRDELTGWGTANIPSYHTQFIAISGIVEFKGDPTKLPTTTTKRGLEFSSRTYQQVLNRMREGTRLFIDFTNWWKQNEANAKQKVMPLPSKDLEQIKSAALSAGIKYSATKTGLKGEFYRPSLPRPKATEVDVRIAITRPKVKVLALAEAVLTDFNEISEERIPKKLGEFLFDDAYSRI